MSSSLRIVLPALWVACQPAPERLAARPSPPADPRAAARQTELRLLADTARQALAEGRPVDAARAVLLGRGLDPAGFAALWTELLRSEDPEVLRLIAGHRGTEPELARELAARAARSEVRARYAEGDPRVRWPGVDLPRASAVLAGVLTEYLAKPDLDAMTAQVEARYAALWELRARFPTWQRLPVGDSPLARITDAMAAGLPEPVACGEGVEAALAALDPYTQPVWPAQLRGWQEHHAGASTGIGVELEQSAAGVFVTGLSVGGPAWAGGVHVGDRLIAADRRELHTVEEAGAALAGEPHTRLSLEVERAGERRALAVVRAVVPEETVRGWTRAAAGWEPFAEPGLAFVHLSAFRPDTDEGFDALLGIADADIVRRPRAVILDLRGNPGGDVMAAINVADRFVKDGVLADLSGRTLPKALPGGNGELPWNAAVPGHPLEGVPVVVLVDGRTASAAEIVAGSLRERVDAVLVGEPTFGKGLSQALRVDEKLGVGWQVTNALWTLPSGTAVEAPGGVHLGLTPDLPVVLTPGEALQVAAMTRRRELPATHPDGTPLPDLGTVARAELVPLEEDPQLREALRVARDLAR